MPFCPVFARLCRPSALLACLCLCGSVGVLWCGSAYAQQPAEAESSPGQAEIIPTRGLLLPPVGTAGRVPVRVDRLEEQLVLGSWQPPAEGASLPSPRGGMAAWQAVELTDGDLQSQSLFGGYVYLPVEAPAEAVYILDAAGHGMVYVNGEPRTGDPYSNGSTKLPVLLHAGTNGLLFHVGRGSLRAKLMPPKKPVYLNDYDLTLPDMLHDESGEAWGAVIVTNATGYTLSGYSIAAKLGEQEVITALPAVLPLATFKVPFTFAVSPTEANEVDLQLRLLAPAASKTDATDAADVAGVMEADSLAVKLRVRQRSEHVKRTFVSQIDGSVQYYAVRQALEHSPEKPAGLVLTLHGAGVEADGQAAAYSSHADAHIVAATNRRPFGFDWEDWGRKDAMEVLQLALARSDLQPTDPTQVYLTGHSMGGHGTWHLGVTFPDQFAAIGPSAGWVSFNSYGGGQRRPEETSAMAAMLARGSNPSNTLGLIENTRGQGIYVLHGSADDNVPVDQARTMREALAKFHPDFAYYEQPGAGHWWDGDKAPGADCVDWPPMFEHFRQHRRTRPSEARQFQFRTYSPAVSANYAWLTIVSQIRPLELSRVDADWDANAGLIKLTTDNVSRLQVDTAAFKPGQPQVQLDGQPALPLSTEGSVSFEITAGTWQVVSAESTAESTSAGKIAKRPDRYGPFKEVFANAAVLVYATGGNAEENAWALAKARYDAETFWYRGNGAFTVLSDTQFNANPPPERNVVLYGRADTNLAWSNCLADNCPIQLTRGKLTMGERTWERDDLACLITYPRANSSTGLVGIVAGTGAIGDKLAYRTPYFLSGVGIPDVYVFSARMLAEGLPGVEAAGYFGPDWSMEQGQFEFAPAQ